MNVHVTADQLDRQATLEASVCTRDQHGANRRRLLAYAWPAWWCPAYKLHTFPAAEHCIDDFGR